MKPCRMPAIAAVLSLVAALSLPAAAQEGAKPAGARSPAATLADALAAACRQQAGDFARYLPESSADAYRNLPQVQQRELMRRMVAVREPGSPLLSTSNDGLPVLRCSSSSETTQLRMVRERVAGNLAFVTVTVPSGLTADFGLVRDPGGWRLISLGLLMLDIPELVKEWAVQETIARERVAVDQMRRIADAVETFHRAFGSLPETLAQLGPAPKDGITPETANLIDAELAAGKKANYSFRYRVYSSSRESDVRYEIIATPTEYGPGGKRSFYLDSNGVLRGADKNGDVAGPDDPRLDRNLEEISEQ